MPLGIKANGEYRYYLTDIQGSILALIDDDGVITDRYEYDEYGAQTRLFGTFPNSLGFTGQYHDEETGLIYLRSRYYDPSIGRFISRDPIGFDGGMNLYVYTKNNSVNYMDVSGKNAVLIAELLTFLILAGYAIDRALVAANAIINMPVGSTVYIPLLPFSANPPVITDPIPDMEYIQAIKTGPGPYDIEIRVVIWVNCSKP